MTDNASRQTQRAVVEGAGPAAARAESPAVMGTMNPTIVERVFL